MKRFHMGTSRAEAATLAVVLLFLVSLPMLSGSSYLIFVVTIGLVYATLGASWDILTGYAGLLSFGHAGMFGVGAYAAVIAGRDLGVPPLIGLIFGALGGALVAGAMALLTMRLNGAYLALMTLAVALIMQILVLISIDFTGGAQGIVGYDTIFEGNSTTSFYFGALIMATLAVVVLKLIGESSYGLKLKAIRDDQVKAQSIGVDLPRTKVQVFALSGAVAGVAGAYYANVIQVLTVEVFHPVLFAGLVIGMAVMGGMGSIYGPAVFGVMYWYLASLLESSFGPGYNELVLGALIIATMVFMPRGIWKTVLDHRHSRRASTLKTNPGETVATDEAKSAGDTQSTHLRRLLVVGNRQKGE